MNRAAWLVVALVAASCTASNPRSCKDGLCTDQAYPFCDADGSFEGTPQTCIAVECTAKQFVRCLGDRAVECNGTGNDYELVECTRGCEDDHGCRECDDNAQCSGDRPVCDTSGACRACAVDDECESQVCEAGACIATSQLLYAAPIGSGTSSCSMAAPCSVSRAFMLARNVANPPTIRMLPGIYTSGLAFDVPTPAPIRVVAAGATITAPVGVAAVNGGSGELRGATIAATQFGLKCGDTGQTGSSLRVTDAQLVAASSLASLASIEGCQLELEGSQLELDASTADAVVIAANGSFKGDRLRISGNAPAMQSQNAISGVGERMTVALTNSVIDNLSIVLLASDSASPGSYVAFGYNTLVLKPGNRFVCTDGFGTAFLTLVLDNNVVVGSQVVDVIEGERCTLRNNVLFPSTARPGNINADPKLADRANRDYHLTSGSPAIDLARPTTVFPAVGQDLDGVARPQGANADSGAYELRP